MPAADISTTLLQELSVLAINIAHEAGALLMDRPQDLGATTKTSPTDTVTIMDKRSEKMIIESILQARPDDGFLGEEGAERESKSGVRWIVDPLDGTTNYLYNLPGWCVSIGVQAQDRSGEWSTVVGVVYSPTTLRLYSAIRGAGALLNGATIKCNDPVTLSQSLLATGFGYESARRVRQGEVLAALAGEVRDIRRMGAAALDLCHVASGGVDAFFERGLAPWDHTAGALIAREAGAIVSDLYGGPESAIFTFAAGPALTALLRPKLESLAADR